MTQVSLSNLSKEFGSISVIKGIDLHINSGEFCVFVGPSGCGKSTLLRMIAGLEDTTSGDIMIGDERVNDMPPKDRGISMVFQSYALFPHKTVYENIAYGLRIAKRPKQEIEDKVRAAADVLKLDSLLDRKPAQLSGGQRQRVAIGRSIVRNPRVFLFDEPLSNLDAALRVSMRTEIAKLHSRLDATMIYVTHDQVEAMTLADKIVVLKDGNIEQVGTPIELYRTPGNIFVAQFIGSPKMNLFSAKDLKDTAPSHLRNDALAIGVRPEHLQICSEAEGFLKATPILAENLGEYVLAHFRTDAGTEFIAKLGDLPNGGSSEPIHFGADPALVHRFDGQTEKRVG